jgi:hypothetical protein
MGEDAAKSVGAGLENATIGTLGGLVISAKQHLTASIMSVKSLASIYRRSRTAASVASKFIPPLGVDGECSDLGRR